MSGFRASGTTITINGQKRGSGDAGPTGRHLKQTVHWIDNHVVRATISDDKHLLDLCVTSKFTT